MRKAAVSAVFALVILAARAMADERPNLIFMIADDCTYLDMDIYGGRAKTIRTDTHRLVVHSGGHAELYDHTSKEKETLNVAESHPDVVDDLRVRLQERLDRD